MDFLCGLRLSRTGTVTSADTKKVRCVFQKGKQTSKMNIWWNTVNKRNTKWHIGDLTIFGESVDISKFGGWKWIRACSECVFFSESLLACRQVNSMFVWRMRDGKVFVELTHAIETICWQWKMQMTEFCNHKLTASSIIRWHRIKQSLA